MNFNSYQLIVYRNHIIYLACLTCRVGPLHGDTDYDVQASKDGYVLTAVDGKPYQFKAFKLGEIKVLVSLVTVAMTCNTFFD